MRSERFQNGIIKSSQWLESNFVPNTTKWGSWWSEISRIIVKLFDLANLTGIKVIVIMHRKSLLLACCITGNYSQSVSWSNTSPCLLLGSRAAVTGLDLDERAADMCVREDSTENYLKAFKATSTLQIYLSNPVKHCSTTQAFTQVEANTLSNISHHWAFAFSPDLLKKIWVAVHIKAFRK